MPEWIVQVSTYLYAIGMLSLIAACVLQIKKDGELTKKKQEMVKKAIEKAKRDEK